MSFLTADWRKLTFCNYKIDPQLLSPYLPSGTELDLYKGACYISLVGMMFKNTRLLGFKIPFHVNFEEVNLRFYVRRLEKGVYKNGVVFIKEIVPKPALSLVAKLVYDEKYETLPMKHSWLLGDRASKIEYCFKKNNIWQRIEVVADSKLIEIPQQSETEFIIERYWGFAKSDATKTYEYEVRHPRWKVNQVKSYHVDVNFKVVYGDAFSFLNQVEPDSVMLTEGSAVSIEKRNTIRL